MIRLLVHLLSALFGCLAVGLFCLWTVIVVLYCLVGIDVGLFEFVVSIAVDVVILILVIIGLLYLYCYY